MSAKGRKQGSMKAPTTFDGTRIERGDKVRAYRSGYPRELCGTVTQLHPHVARPSVTVSWPATPTGRRAQTGNHASCMLEVVT